LKKLLSQWAYASTGGSRDLRIDFLRGMVMAALIVGHIEIFSWFNYLTWERIGVVSGAEGFVIFAGIVMGFLYRKKIQQVGLYESAKLMIERAFKLYRVNIFVIASIALLALIPFIDVTGATTFTDRGPGVTYPLYPKAGTDLHIVIAQILLLQAGPHEVQILGLYFILFLFAPLAFYLLEKGQVGLLSGLSFVLYMKNWAFPAMPTGTQFEYGFPVLTWQLIFFHGLIFGYYKQEISNWFTGNRKTVALVAAYILFIGFMLFTWNNPHPFMPPSSKLTWIAPDTFNHLYSLYFQKNTLGVLRLINYVVVLTVLFHLLTLFWVPINKAFGWFFITFGQASLYVFILHVYVLLFIYNIPIFHGLTASYTSGNIWVNTVGHALAMGMLWTAAHYKIGQKWIPS
jgi:hypothetical protein